MIFFTGLGPLLTGKRLQLIAKASHRNGAIVRPPAILRAGGRTLHGDHLPAVLRFQQQRRAAVARQGVALMRQYAGLRPPCHDAILVAVKIIEMIFRIARLGNFTVRRLQRGGEIGLAARKERDRRNARRSIAQHDQTKIGRRRSGRDNPAVAIGFQASA